jgi:hypothetical protein
MLRTAKWSAALCLLIVLCGSAAHAQTVINAASCNKSDVSKALGQVSSGSYIVAIPSGTCTWTSQLSYTIPSAVTNLTIQGNTAVNCTGTAGTSSYACTPTDNTVLVDAYAAANQQIWSITTGAASTSFRITGITFQGGNLAQGLNKPSGFIVLYGSTHSLRVDHCHFNTQTYTIHDFGGGVTHYGLIYGVYDHNRFDFYGTENGVRDYAGGDAYGDLPYSQPTGFGSVNFIFLENNEFNGGFVNDCNLGAQEVVRYNMIISDSNDTAADSGAIQTHAMGQGTQRERGCRAMEEYHNYQFNPTPAYPEYGGADGDTGTGLRWGNTLSSGYQFDMVFQEIREIAAGHAQTNAPNGIGYCGSSSNGVVSPWDGNSGLKSGGWPCIDQTGRGQGDLINGQNFPVMAAATVTGTYSWPHNMLEPWYVWNETIVSGNIYNLPCWNGVCRNPNLDFYSQVGTTANTSPSSPFNGTTGTGFGTLTNRPSTCTAGPGGTYGQSPTGSYGVAYFATDANSGNGELYVCTATNTWTAIYTPYTYPHPLTTGGSTGNNSGAPAPPTNVSATVQ